MEQIVECSISGFQIEKQLTNLWFAELIGCLHRIQCVEPVGNLFLALKSRWNQWQTIHCVNQITQFRMQFIHGFDFQTQFIHQCNEQRHNISNTFAGVSFVIFDCDRAIFLDALQCGRTVKPKLFHKCIHRLRVKGRKIGSNQCFIRFFLEINKNFAVFFFA